MNASRGNINSSPVPKFYAIELQGCRGKVSHVLNFNI